MRNGRAVSKPDASGLGPPLTMNLGFFKVPEHAKIVQQLLHDFGMG
jgi:hypothetical protein